MNRVGTLAVALLLTLLVAACGSGPGETSGGSAGPSTASSRAPETNLPAETQTFDPSLPSQSDTTWGPIWDAIPPSYPVPDGAKDADAPDGPVSAAFSVPTSVSGARAIAEFYQGALEEGGFGGTGLDGPLEDGSFTVWSSNGYGCDSLVTVTPRGTESLITILYGALCTFQ